MKSFGSLTAATLVTGYLTAAATDSTGAEGASAQVTITVTSSGPMPIHVLANPISQ